MATSGSKSVAVTAHDTLKFNWSLSSQSVANNTSTVSWNMQLISDSYGRISSTASKDWSVTVNGTKYSGTNTVGIANSTTKTLASGTTTIAHASDGTKTFSYSFSQQFSITFSGESIGTKSGSGSGTLTTIPRKSTLSVGNGVLGVAQTLSVTRQSTSFTHTIVATCGSASTTIVSKSTSTSISFTPPESWASQNTTGTSVSVKYTITTYNGSTSIGSNSYTKTCSIPSGEKPTVSMTVEDANGHEETYGAYIQGMSKFKVILTAAGSSGSTIKSYKTTANGGTYTTSSFTTGVITTSGTLSIATTVTDSRSRTATANKSVTVLAYAAPKISAFSVARCNQDGTANSDGSYMKVTFSSSVTSLNNKNKATYTLKYKKSTDSAYTSVTLSNYANNYAVSNGTYIFAADPASSYNVNLTLADNFKSVSPNGTGSSASKLISFLKQGKGIAIGKVAEHSGYFENDLLTRFNKNVYFANGTSYYIDTNGGMKIKNIYFINGGCLWSANGDGTANLQLIYCDANNNTIVGNGGYNNSVGGSYLYGNAIYLYSKNALTSNKSLTVSSDRNLKKDFETFSDKHDTFFDNLKPTIYKYILNDKEKHFGYVAQEVEEALEKAGLEIFAGISIMPIENRQTMKDEEGNEIDIEGSTSNYLLDKGLNEQHNIAYDEFISLNTWQIQKLKTKVKEQQQEIDNLKEEMQQLKELVAKLVS